MLPRPSECFDLWTRYPRDTLEDIWRLILTQVAHTVNSPGPGNTPGLWRNPTELVAVMQVSRLFHVSRF